MSAILAIVGRTKLIFELEQECDGSNPCMKIGRNQNKNDYVRVTTTADERKMISGGHFVGHLGYSLSDKPQFELEPEFDGSKPYMKFGRNLIKMTKLYIA